MLRAQIKTCGIRLLGFHASYLSLESSIRFLSMAGPRWATVTEFPCDCCRHLTSSSNVAAISSCSLLRVELLANTVTDRRACRYRGSTSLTTRKFRKHQQCLSIIADNTRTVSKNRLGRNWHKVRRFVRFERSWIIVAESLICCG
jgi:hypothetical protein